MDNIIQKSKHHIWKLILIILGAIVLIYAIFFVYQVLTIRNQILSGNYNWEQYGSQTSGAGGANVSTRTYEVATQDDPSVGAANPKVTIVEFGDFQCPFCLKAFPIIRTLVAKFKNDVKLIYRDFPLDDHPLAEFAARAGYCVHEQQLFWAFHDKVFQNQSNLSEASIINFAVQAGVEKGKFLVCLNSQTASEEVKEDVRAGRAAGVSGTPTWFINGYRVAGVIPQDVLEKIIQEIIKNK